MDTARKLRPEVGMIAVEAVPVSQPAALKVEHTADRSSWDCRVCDEPWPCAPAKVALVEEHLTCPSLLIIFLVATFHEARQAATDAGGGAPADLFERFVMWAVRRRQ